MLYNFCFRDTMIHTTSFEPSHPLALKELDHLDLALNPTTPTSTAPHILSPPSINQSKYNTRINKYIMIIYSLL